MDLVDKGDIMKVSYKRLPPNLSSKAEFRQQNLVSNFQSMDICFEKLSDLLKHNGIMIANVELTNGY